MKKTIGLIIISLIVVLGVAIALFKLAPPKNSQQPVSALNDLMDKPMPPVVLYDKDGKEFSIENLKGKNVVLFFSEGIICYPACWDEIAALGTDQRFNNSETIAISVVTDTPQDWAPAKDRMPDIAKATMLFDKGMAVSKQLALLTQPSSMHMGGRPGHTYIMLDKQGIVRYVLDDPTMNKNGNLLLSKIAEFKNN